MLTGKKKTFFSTNTTNQKHIIPPTIMQRVLNDSEEPSVRLKLLRQQIHFENANENETFELIQMYKDLYSKLISEKGAEIIDKETQEFGLKIMAFELRKQSMESLFVHTLKGCLVKENNATTRSFIENSLKILTEEFKNTVLPALGYTEDEMYDMLKGMGIMMPNERDGSNISPEKFEEEKRINKQIGIKLLSKDEMDQRKKGWEIKTGIWDKEQKQFREMTKDDMDKIDVQFNTSKIELGESLPRKKIKLPEERAIHKLQSESDGVILKFFTYDKETYEHTLVVIDNEDYLYTFNLDSDKKYPKSLEICLGDLNDYYELLSSIQTHDHKIKGKLNAVIDRIQTILLCYGELTDESIDMLEEEKVKSFNGYCPNRNVQLFNDIPIEGDILENDYDIEFNPVNGTFTHFPLKGDMSIIKSEKAYVWIGNESISKDDESSETESEQSSSETEDDEEFKPTEDTIEEIKSINKSIEEKTNTINELTEKVKGKCDEHYENLLKKLKEDTKTIEEIVLKAIEFQISPDEIKEGGTIDQIEFKLTLQDYAIYNILIVMQKGLAAISDTSLKIEKNKFVSFCISLLKFARNETVSVNSANYIEKVFKTKIEAEKREVFLECSPNEFFNDVIDSFIKNYPYDRELINLYIDSLSPCTEMINDEDYEKLFSIDEFKSLVENLNKEKVDAETILQTFNESLNGISKSNYAKGYNFYKKLTDSSLHAFLEAISFNSFYDVSQYVGLFAIESLDQLANDILIEMKNEITEFGKTKSKLTEEINELESKISALETIISNSKKVDGDCELFYGGVISDGKFKVTISGSERQYNINNSNGRIYIEYTEELEQLNLFMNHYKFKYTQMSIEQINESNIEYFYGMLGSAKNTGGLRKERYSGARKAALENLTVDRVKSSAETMNQIIRTMNKGLNEEQLKDKLFCIPTNINEANKILEDRGFKSKEKKSIDLLNANIFDNTIEYQGLNYYEQKWFGDTLIAYLLAVGFINSKFELETDKLDPQEITSKVRSVAPKIIANNIMSKSVIEVVNQLSKTNKLDMFERIHAVTPNGQLITSKLMKKERLENLEKRKFEKMLFVYNNEIINLTKVKDVTKGVIATEKVGARKETFNWWKNNEIYSMAPSNDKTAEKLIKSLNSSDATDVLVQVGSVFLKDSRKSISSLNYETIIYLMNITDIGSLNAFSVKNESNNFIGFGTWLRDKIDYSYLSVMELISQSKHLQYYSLLKSKLTSITNETTTLVNHLSNFELKRLLNYIGFTVKLDRSNLSFSNEFEYLDNRTFMKTAFELSKFINGIRTSNPEGKLFNNQMTYLSATMERTKINDDLFILDEQISCIGNCATTGEVISVRMVTKYGGYKKKCAKPINAEIESTKLIKIEDALNDSQNIYQLPVKSNGSLFESQSKIDTDCMLFNFHIDDLKYWCEKAQFELKNFFVLKGDDDASNLIKVVYTNVDKKLIISDLNGDGIMKPWNDGNLVQSIDTANELNWHANRTELFRSIDKLAPLWLGNEINKVKEEKNATCQHRYRIYIHMKSPEGVKLFRGTGKFGIRTGSNTKSMPMLKHYVLMYKRTIQSTPQKVVIFNGKIVLANDKQGKHLIVLDHLVHSLI